MWEVKNFKTLEAQKVWIARNEHKYQIIVLFVNNGYAVEYKKLRSAY